MKIRSLIKKLNILSGGHTVFGVLRDVLRFLGNHVEVHVPNYTVLNAINTCFLTVNRI